MEYLAHWVAAATGFLLLLVAYAAGLYLVVLLVLLVLRVRQARVLELGPALELLAGASLVYLLTCATWFWIL